MCTLEAIASWENLFAAAGRARAGKARRPDVESWWMRRESELTRIREDLLSGNYVPGPYRQFYVNQPKRRLIAAAPFGDRVVHHALCELLRPVLESRFIARSFSCQIGKGTSSAREHCRQLTNRHSHVLKCDIRKFFPSIDHEILKAKLRPWIRCPGALSLVCQIIDGHTTGAELPPFLFPGDDLATVQERRRGLPIGNLTSQLWANLYLDDLDHWLTEQMGCGAYLRYTDDFLIFDDDAGALNRLRDRIAEHMVRDRLKLAERKSRVFATCEGVPFLGFRFLPDLRPRILGATKRRFEARRTALHRAGDMRRLGQSVVNWYQFSREGNTTGLRRAYAFWSFKARLRRRRRRFRPGSAGRFVDQ
jgi:retron-type reverse transcriptase